MSYDREKYLEEPSPIEFELRSLFDKEAIITVFDIGACEGEDSIRYRRLFPKANIYAFEPLPDNVRLINQNFLRHGIKNVKCVNKAVSSKNETASFYVSSGRPANAVESDWDYGNKSSSLLQPEESLIKSTFLEFKRKIEVETITIDHFCQENDIREIDFVHLDVQGAEKLVLDGAKEMMNSIKLIWLEVSGVRLYRNQPLAQQIQKTMKKNGFVLIKNTLENFQGDQLYLSDNIYKEHENIFFECGGFKRNIARGTLKWLLQKIKIK